MLYFRNQKCINDHLQQDSVLHQTVITIIFKWVLLFVKHFLIIFQ